MKSGEIRHAWPDRLFHWIMAVLVILLLGTSFLPIAGIRFGWVTIHWISGVLLCAAILFHLYRVFVVHGVRSMLPTWAELAALVRLKAHNTEDKYDFAQKAYHWSVSLLLLLLAGTGLVMMAKIDTPWWNRDPAILSDNSWGVIYVLHGASALLLIFFFIIHIYFTILPEHRQLLAAMALGRPLDRTRN